MNSSLTSYKLMFHDFVWELCASETRALNSQSLLVRSCMLYEKSEYA